MAIKINLESTVIPVEIGDMKFEIDVTDEKYEAFIKNFNVFLSKMEVLDENKSEDVAQLKVMVKEIYDELLGAEAYEQIYAKMSNIAFVSGVLVSVVKQLMEEMDQKTAPKSQLKLVEKK